MTYIRDEDGARKRVLIDKAVEHSPDMPYESVVVRFVGGGSRSIDVESWLLGSLRFSRYRSDTGLRAVPYRPNHESTGLLIGLCLAGEVSIVQENRRTDLIPEIGRASCRERG